MEKLKKFISTTAWTYHLVYSLNPKLIILIVACQLLTTILPFVEQRQLSRLIDSLISYFNTNDNIWLHSFALLIIVRLIKIALFQVFRLASRIQQFTQDNELAKIYTRKVSSLDYQQLEDKEVATLMAKVSEEYRWRIRQVFGDITELISQFIGFATVIYFLVPQYWYIALILIAGEIPSLIVDNIGSKKSNAVFEKNVEKTRFAHDINWQLVDKKYISELKINQAIDWISHKAFAAFDQFLHERIKVRLEQFIPNFTASTISSLVGVFCMFLIIQEIKLGHITIGMFTFYFGIIRQTGDFFSSIFSHYNSIAEQLPHITNFKKILQLENKIDSGNLIITSNQAPSIEFRDVSFKYPNSNRYVFRHLNLTISSGEEIAIVGENGAGKSTLIKLVCRFYDPTSGKILINGQDLRHYQLDSWYHQLSLLNQEFNTYHNLSLRDNVIAGKPQEVSDNKVIDCLKKAEAHNFIRHYSQGLETIMSQRYGGEEPSWGQWQKIAIARSFYRDTPILILDEPTASIDAIAESKIFANIYQQMTGKTLIIVSHRFSTVRKAQRIIVIDNGKIVEQGTHQQLLKNAGLYARSFNLQASGYTTN